MSLLLSEPDAALLEASCLAGELAQRLRHACDELVDSETLRQTLAVQAERLDELAQRLDGCVRARGLMPRVSDPELAGLRGLADQLTGFMNETGLRKLLERFIAEQTTLRERLDAACSDAAADGQTLREGADLVRAQAGELERLAG